jgi:hypothetical protein
MDLGAIAQQLSDSGANKQSLPPVDKWDPPFCGDMNLVIKNNGDWWHEGTPFTRAKLVHLLASVLKKEDDNYFLVTPVEKIGIQVEDVPFIIVDWQQTEKGLSVKTQIGDAFILSEDHPVELREFNGIDVPYCLVRRNLWARLHQNVLYQWVDLAETKHNDGKRFLQISSADYHFNIGSY